MCATAKNQAPISERRAAILALIEAAPEGLTRAQIGESIGMRVDRLTEIMLTLAHEGLIDKVRINASEVRWAAPALAAKLRAHYGELSRIRTQALNAIRHQRHKEKRQEAARLKRERAPTNARLRRKPAHAVRIKSPPPAPMFVFNLARLSQHESTECTPC